MVLSRINTVLIDGHVLVKGSSRVHIMCDEIPNTERLVAVVVSSFNTV